MRTRIHIKRISMTIFYVVILTILFDVSYIACTLSKQVSLDQNSFSPDELLGWKHRGNYVFQKEGKDLNGATYQIHYSSHANGFRSYPERTVDSAKTLLVLGDSFTQALDVSNDKTYHHLLGKELGYQVYAYGMAGYSTLQEYMILDKYLDSIQPNLVLVQFCSNDFMGNDLELMWNSIYAEGGRRPYLHANGEIFYEYPTSTFKRLMDRSLISKKLLISLGMYEEKTVDNSSQKLIGELEESYPPYAASIATTKTILQMMLDRLGSSAQLAVFCSDHYEPQHGGIDKVCQQLEIPFMAIPEAEMLPNASKLENFSSDGWHWNENGHAIIAKHLSNFLHTITKTPD